MRAASPQAAAAVAAHDVLLEYFPASEARLRTALAASQLNQDAVDARVWSGIHFRTADEVGRETGTQVGDWALDNYFQPTR